MSRILTIIVIVQYVTIGPYCIWFFSWLLNRRDHHFYKWLWAAPVNLVSGAIVQWADGSSFFWKFIGTLSAAWGIYIYRKHKDDDDNDHWWGRKLSRVKMKVVDLGHRLVAVPELAPVSA